MKLECDGPLLDFASNFNLRRYNEEEDYVSEDDNSRSEASAEAIHEVQATDKKAKEEAKYSSYEVGRCRLTLSKPVLKAPTVSTLEATIG